MPCDKLILPISIIILNIWIYYVYVVEVCIMLVKDVQTITWYLTIFHILYIMVHCCFFKTVCGPSPTVPRSYRVSDALYLRLKDLESGAQINSMLLQFCTANELTVVTRNVDGHIRFCKKCKHVKPDRSHHCSACNQCVLKMDHHCPWLNSCIHLWNYKFFVLLLFYGSLNCIFFFATSVKYFVQFWAKSPVTYDLVHMTIGFMYVTVIGICITVFFIYHLTQICSNRTSIELIQRPNFSDGNQDLTFDLGICGNITEVMGNSCCLMFLPVYTNECNGLEYPLARAKD